MASFDKQREAVAAVVSHEILTCPWRSLQHPLVKEIVQIANLADKGLGAAMLDADSPAILADALSVYFAARGASYAHHMHEKQEADRKARNARR